MTALAVKKVVLPNGLRVILAPQPGLTATALILVEAGSEYETGRTNGVSHFLEHMVFKGTRSRPHSSIITETLDGLGANYNAFTLQESTGYWAKARKEKLPQLLDLVSDLYIEPIFDPAELEKERGVIIEELNMREDMPTWRSYYVLQETLYGDQPAGWRIGGTRETVAGIKREDVIAYRTARYVPGTTIIAVAGDFDEKNVMQFIEERFGQLPAVAAPPKDATVESQMAPRLAVTPHRTSDQIHLALAIRTFPVSDSRRHAAEVLAHILGGGMSSRLFKILRDELGATYYVSADNQNSIDHGYLSVTAGVTPSKLPEVVRAIVKECAALSRDAVSAAELRRVKDHLIGTFMLDLEGSDSLAEFFADQELFTKEVLPPEDYAAKLEAVSAEEITVLARDIFTDPNLNLSLLGEVADPELVRQILSFSA